MTKLIKDDENKTKLKALLSNPDVLHNIHKKMIVMFSEWALGEPDSWGRILKYRDEFKILVEACLNAKTNLDEREVLLALDLIADEYAASIVLAHGEMVEKVEEPVAQETTH